ncbi:MAG: CAP domain-containing protein [Cyclobacteriaceae bacterium]|nr:CAP domain-containing protein [Cyclobacteriaceae bacterium]
MNISRHNKYTGLAFLLIVLVINSCREEETVINEDFAEAKSAFEYLNMVRLDPASFSSEIGVDLGYVNPIQLLTWNDTLAQVALEKARDMAARNYFDHVDPDGNGMNIKIHEAAYTLNPSWVADKSLSYFESIAAGYDNGIAMVKGLILDEGVNPPGHRNHLLGIDPFWADCYDVGVGFVTVNNAEYISYGCILIAKHQ